MTSQSYCCWFRHFTHLSSWPGWRFQKTEVVTLKRAGNERLPQVEGRTITIMMSKYLLIGMIVITVWFAHWSGLIGAFLSDHKMYPIRWSAYVYDDAERVRTQGYWLTEIVDNHYKFNSMLWLPNSDNTGGFLEISYYERKTHWWRIW